LYSSLTDEAIFPQCGSSQVFIKKKKIVLRHLDIWVFYSKLDTKLSLCPGPTPHVFSMQYRKKGKKRKHSPFSCFGNKTIQTSLEWAPNTFGYIRQLEVEKGGGNGGQIIINTQPPSCFG
jgi:hypothetical protein